MSAELHWLDGFEQRLADLAAELDAAAVRGDVRDAILREMLDSYYKPEGPLSLTPDEVRRASDDWESVLAAARSMERHEHQALDWFRSSFRSVCRYGPAAAAAHHSLLLDLTPEEGAEPLGSHGAALIDDFVAALRARALALTLDVARFPTAVVMERHFPKWSRVLPFADIARFHRAGAGNAAILDALAQSGFDLLITQAILFDGGAPTLNEGIL